MANISNINNILRTGSLGVGINCDAEFSLDIEKASANAILSLNSNGGDGAEYLLSSTTSGEFVLNKRYVGDRLTISSGGDATFAGDVIIAEASNKGQLFFGTANTDYEIKGGGNYGYLSLNAPILRFDTGGSERMRITSDGNVTFAIGSDTDRDANSIKHASNGFLYIKGGAAGISINDDGEDTRMILFNNGNIRFDAGTKDNAMIIEGSTGNVGIGTDSPLGKLHIQTASTGQTPYSQTNQLVIENTGNSGIQFLAGTTNFTGMVFGDSDSGQRGQLYYDNNTDSFTMITSATTGSGIFINSSGDVGIGTDSPTEKLEVKGNIVLNGQSTATGTTELDSLIFRKLHPSGASSGYYNQGLIKGVTYGGYAGGMNFYYNRSNNDGSGSYTNTQALWLNQYGNFCIGENSSSYKLRVKGGTIANNSVSNGVYVTAGTSSSNHALYVEGESSGGEWLAVRGDGEIRLNASNGHTYAAQGIRFGANATANNLDDYEEGTWVGTMANDGVGNTATGSYTKIGNRVFFEIYFAGKSITNAGTADVTGFPFTASTNAGYGGAWYWHGNATNQTVVGAYNTGTMIRLVQLNSTTLATWKIGAGWVMLAGCYKTTS